MSSNSENNTHDDSGERADEQTPDAVAESDAVLEVTARSQAIADAEIEAGGAIAMMAAELAAEFEALEPGTDGPHLTVVPVEKLTSEHVRNVLEAALFAADEALTVDRLFKLFMPEELAEENGRGQIRDALAELEAASEGRGFELKQVASGYRMQVRQKLSPWVSRLWEEKPPRYTRALLETMALIAYKQPATRGDIEEVRGVAVSSNIMRTLLERGWIREVGQRDVPGRPSMYGTTKEFLDYFNLSSLDQLPSLPELRELVEPVQTPDEPIAKIIDEKAGAKVVEPGADTDTEDQSDAAEPMVAEQMEDDDLEVVAAEEMPHADFGEDLKSVDTPDAAADPGTGVTNSSAPVFADNEVLVVSESANVEVQQTSELTTLPSADSQE